MNAVVLLQCVSAAVLFLLVIFGKKATTTMNPREENESPSPTPPAKPAEIDPDRLAGAADWLLDQPVGVEFDALKSGFSRAELYSAMAFLIRCGLIDSATISEGGKGGGL